MSLYIGIAIALVAVVAGPATVLVLNLVKGFPIDPLFVGVFVSFMIMLSGYRKGVEKDEI